MVRLLKFLPRILFSQGQPLQLIFFITAQCNLRCRHCFYIKNINNQKNELSLKEIEKISENMDNLLWLSLTGGEPFLREDITQIAEIFYRNNKFNLLTISTNGILQNSIIQSVSEICRICKDSHIIVYVSIDGLEDIHNQIRGTPDGFKKALSTIQELKKLKDRFRNLNVATATTCNAINQNEMKALALFLKDEVRPDSIAINLIRGEPCLGPMGEIDLKHYLDFIKILEDGWSARDLGYFSFLGKSFIQRKELLQKKIIATVFNEDRYVIPCLAGKLNAVLTETGNIYPCEILNKKIGNIRDVNFEFRKLWTSDEAGKIRKFIKDSKCYCTYECAITMNILFNIKQLVKLCIKRDSFRLI